MADILMANNDIVISGGDFVLSGNNTSTIQLANNRMSIRYGELIHHPEIGNNIDSQVKLTDSGLNIIADECRQAILQGPDISEVIEITATRNMGIAYGCDISYIIKTTDGDILTSTALITKI